MLFSNISSMNPDIKITREEAMKLLLDSIAFEELGLARIINSEEEKIKYVLSAYENINFEETTPIKELIMINKSVGKSLKAVARNYILLQFKLEDILEILEGMETTTTTKSTTCTHKCNSPLNYATFTNQDIKIESSSLTNSGIEINQKSSPRATCVQNSKNDRSDSKNIGEIVIKKSINIDNQIQDISFQGKSVCVNDGVKLTNRGVSIKDYFN